MTDTPNPERTPYPSRRSLRDATPAASPETEYVRVPLPAHEPLSTIPTHAQETRKPSMKRRIAGAAALASVGGLVLTMALPLVEQSAPKEEAAAGTQQRLFSEVSPDTMPASFTEISAVDSRSAAPASYEFSADSVVNYPFKQQVMLTDPFGYRTAPVAQFHDAQDFAASEGTPIYAIAEGKVLEAGYQSDGCGFGVKLEHEIDGSTVTSRYCHMQDGSNDLAEGDSIGMGDPVGKVGATGMAFGAHLHLAIRIDDKPADPMPFLSKYHRMDRTELAKRQPEPIAVETDPTSGATAAADARQSGQ